MEIQQLENGNKGKFFIEEGNERLAEIVYTLKPGLLIIDHTEVDVKLRGKNIGYLLVDHATGYARTNNLKVIPICPFARAIFKKRHDQYKDVLESKQY